MSNNALTHAFAKLAEDPGWRARMAELRQEREAFRAATLAKYGSEDAALAPNDREHMLDQATKPFQRTVRKKFANGTFDTPSLRGWTDPHGRDQMPAEIRAAVSRAYPLPVTLREARAEIDYWHHRDREREAAANYYDSNTMLDLPSSARLLVVEELFKTMPATDAVDLLVRLDWAIEACRDDLLNPDVLEKIREDYVRLIGGETA